VKALDAAQNDPRPLRRFKRAIGDGHINTAGRNTNGIRHQWEVSGTARVLTTLDLLLPYLSAPKREQLARVMCEWRLYQRSLKP